MPVNVSVYVYCGWGSFPIFLRSTAAGGTSEFGRAGLGPKDQPSIILPVIDRTRGWMAGNISHVFFSEPGNSVGIGISGDIGVCIISWARKQARSWLRLILRGRQKGKKVEYFRKKSQIRLEKAEKHEGAQ